MSYNDMTVYAKALQDNMFTCKCGHRVFIRPKNVSSICNWCGRSVYRNKKEEFIDRLEKKLYGRKNIRGIR